MSKWFNRKNKNNKKSINALDLPAMAFMWIQKRAVLFSFEGLRICMTSSLYNTGVYVTYVIFFTLIFFAFSVSPSFSKDFSSDPFFPLEIGNEWSYKHFYYDEELKEPKYSKVLIANKIDKQNRTIEFTGEDNAALFYKTIDGIMSSAGFLILPHSLSLGAHWESGTYNYNKRHARLEAVGVSTQIGATKYKNCIRILSKSDAHAFSKREKTVYLAHESKTTYCPYTGPVLIETFEVSELGERKPLSRSELISFKKGQRIKKKNTTTVPLIGINESFRFPEKDLLDPSISPDDKWLIYRKNSVFSGHAAFHSLNTAYKKMYYSRIGQSEKIQLPLPSEKLDRVGWFLEWSQDGKILALGTEIDEKSSIILLDFSSSKARIMEYFKAKSLPFYWTAENALIYVGISGNIMKKNPGKAPEKTVSLGNGQHIYDLRLASNGTLLYSLSGNPWSVYKSNIKNPNNRTLLFEYNATPIINLSPDGQYALISTGDREKPAALYDLETNISIMKIPADVQNCRFSPDGTKLAYQENKIPPYYPSKNKYINPHFFIMDLKTRQIRDYGYSVNKYFNWTPDGNHIIYSMKCIHESLGAYENGIYIVRVSSGEEVAKLTLVNSYQAPIISRTGKYIVWEGADMNTFFIVKNPMDANVFRSVKVFQLMKTTDVPTFTNEDLEEYGSSSVSETEEEENIKAPWRSAPAPMPAPVPLTLHERNEGGEGNALSPNMIKGIIRDGE